MSKKLVSLFLALLMAFGAAASMAEDTKITVTDMFGREITLDEPATRIVVMQPSDCEILCALGCEDTIVGRGQYVDYPASILAEQHEPERRAGEAAGRQRREGRRQHYLRH